MTKKVKNPLAQFGFSMVSPREKRSKVDQVFSSVHKKYDLMNDLMSIGLHRKWKQFAVDLCRLKNKDFVLDIASGTGDIARSVAKVVGNSNVIVSDVNYDMLSLGRKKLEDGGVNVAGVQCDSENIPFPSETFDCVTVAFGVRNMTNKEEALREIHRVLKWGGKVVVIEFSKIWAPLEPIYDNYSFRFIPALGEFMARDRSSYKYLAESIKMHPSQQEFKKLMGKAGFEIVDYFNLSFGIVAVHRGFK
tara:strand:+ start:479 stop:1222 length:744 start_codon:yes stop_codon:yes gene_type:complete